MYRFGMIPAELEGDVVFLHWNIYCLGKRQSSDDANAWSLIT